ncbi:hypothetical protein BDQ94DRAFT_154184 [Aspergillus welwitschiae]|uniref:Uncharacterized protein n=1 Tax=Aspergillus welwitschiae TaxID=1341132 RepID=A0A3F3PK08_9EURO|nr:hypothetical protein BDQ94DRAFT_154184 [Aspergillus welwitschiae]RDH27284.1 hypothetical protein BDQ94DRAFT_154184 [Aspergillus welwitschiae]
MEVAAGSLGKSWESWNTVTGKLGDGVLFPCLEKMVFWIWSKEAVIRIEGRSVP